MTRIGIGTVTAANTVGAVTLTAGARVGQTVVGAIAWESSGGTIPTISSVVDSRGNTWTTDVSAGGAGNTTVAVAIFRTRVTTALQVGDTITVTLSASRIRWAMQYDAFDEPLPSALDKTAVNNNPGSDTNLVSGTTAAITQPFELVYAAFAMGVGRGPVIPAGWQGSASVETAVGSTDRALQVIYQFTSAAGAQQAPLTLTTASTYAAGVATYKAWAPPGPRTVLSGATSRAATR